MYNFIDVNQASEGTILPSEALKINGQYIEDQISGYRTLNVTGREALSPDVISFTTGVRDGSLMQSKRFPERIITVRYQLKANSNQAFREAYNKLGQILNVKDAELIFADEQDKFFVGTPCIIGLVDPGQNCVVGEFEILCTDPFKYSVFEYEAAPAEGENSVTFHYEGTYQSHPTLQAEFYNEQDVGADGETEAELTGAGDCGFVAFFNEEEKIIQLGDPDEIDGENAYAKAQTMINQTFKDSTSWGTTAKKLWSVNAGVFPPVAVVTQAGSVGMGQATYSETNVSGYTSGHLKTFESDGVSFSISYATEKRTASGIDIKVTITSKVTSNSIPKARTYMATLRIGGKDKTLYLKEDGVAWERNKSYTTSTKYTITGLASTGTLVTDNRFTLYFEDEGTTSHGTIFNQAGMPNIAVYAYNAQGYATYYITAADYGSGSAWHGPSITRSIGADASGEVGASNFTLTYEQKMCIGNQTADVNQRGGFHVHLSDSAGKVVAGVRLVKTASGRSVSLMLFVNNIKVHQVGLDISHYNQYFGSGEKSVKTSTIQKTGKTVSFNIGGYCKTFTDDAITDLKVTKVTFMFEKYSNVAALSYNGLYWAKFVKNNCNTYEDIPNKFSANDIVVADCKNAEITLNGILAPDLGALGNDWEGFVLTPGINQVGFTYSDWVTAEYAPKFKVRYREVFL